MNKKFKLTPNDIKQLIQSMERCIATDTITVNGLLVGYVDRYPTEIENNSGWCFMSGNESQDYMDNPDNMSIYDVNTIANYDPAIIPYLNKPHGTSWKRIEGTNEFEQIEQPDLF